MGSVSVMSEVYHRGSAFMISSELYSGRKGATGTISAPPSEVTQLSGPWDDDLTRIEQSALGEAIVYWVWFDEPQRDADGDGRATAADCIHGRSR